MDIETLLHDEIQSELEALKEMEVGTKEYDSTVAGLTKLIDRAIEMDKYNIAHEEKLAERDEEKENLEYERELKTQQMKEERIDRIVKNIFTGLGIALPLMVTVWGTNKSLKFEETGTVTTTIGRGFLNKLLPKK